MISAISLNRANLFLLRKQHLSDDAQDDNIFQITDDISGLHATGTKEPYLALFARTKNFLREQLDDELYVKRRLGKIRCMRGTLYILTKAMIPVVYAATGPMVERLSRRYSEFHGLSAEEYREISGPTLELLKGKEMTIARIRAGLGTKSHISSALNLMCDQGLLVRIQPRNGWKYGSYHYAIFQEYFDDIDLTAFNESDGTTQLVRRYLRSFGPTTETDIAWWTGLNKGRIREALDNLSGETTRLSIPELTGDFIILCSELSAITNTQPTDENIVNLLPALDPYLMGYKRRDRYLTIEHYNRVFDRSGNATSTILGQW